MKRLVWIIKIVVLLIALLLGAVFAMENGQSVAVRLWGLTLPEFRLGVWLLSFALVGVLLGFVVSYGGYFALRRRLHARERQLARREKELLHLRSASLRES